LDEAANALRLARIALAGVPAGMVAVRQFDDSPLAALVAADPDTSHRVARSILGGVLTLPGEERDTLLGTLDARIASLGSATEAGRRLFVHPNTVCHRLRRIEAHTGRSLEDPRNVAELTIALEATHLFPGLGA
jgi:DNA-binding PucR family transcriptional regulator